MQSFYRKGPGMEARLAFLGHALMENRSGLIVDACLTKVCGHAERVAALAMSKRSGAQLKNSAARPSR